MSEYEELDAQLRAWLAEDEALANAAHNVDPAPWTVDGHISDQSYTRQRSRGGEGMLVAADGVEMWDCEGASGLCMTGVSAFHIAAHHPRAVLADIAGKVALLDHVASWSHELVDGDWWFSCSQAVLPHNDEPGSGCADEKRKGKPCDCGLDGRRLAVLRCVAAGYVERAGFKDTWRIDGRA